MLDLEKRLEASLLAKLPAVSQPERMEVDDQDLRLQQLEQQVQQITHRQTQLETSVQDFQVQSTAQVQFLQTQMASQFDMQSRNIQTQLSDQMGRIEAILSKRKFTE